ncbi:MAG: hypothetical protein ABSC54_03905 [Smithellaceae bacterium]|jgi:hypothetical protein
MLLPKKEFRLRPFLPEGSMIMALVITLLFFSLLVVSMLSTMGSSIFNQLNTTATTKAAYIAKSGYSYLASNYKSQTTEATKNSILETLHGITYALLNNAGSFVLNVSPYYFRTITSHMANGTDLRSGDTINFRFPGGVTYAPAAGSAAVYMPTAYGWFTYTVSGSANNYTLTLTSRPHNIITNANFTTSVSAGTSVVPMLTTPASNQTLTNGGNLTVTGASAIYPARFGFFEIPQADAAHVYTYDTCAGNVFTNITDANNPSRTFSYTNVNAYRVVVHTSAQINSTGTFNTGSGQAITPVSNTYSRMAILGYTVGGNSNNASPYANTITGTGGFTALGTGVTVNAASNTITLGNSTANTGGVAWYAGNSDAAYCVSGICNSPYGIRAYFTFADSYTCTGTCHGDGFTFTVMNGANNDASRRGGMPAITGMGELMAYAGPGNTVAAATAPRANTLDGLGLAPPKMAIEFDKYTNAGVTSAGCSNGRNDAANDHMALMLWGANTAGNCATGTTLAGYLAASCDDNIHGAGTAGDPDYPQNSYTGDGTGGYYDLGSTTFFDTTASHTARIEIFRNPTANADGNYNYNVQAWIDCTNCSDVTIPYTAATPQINRTIELSPAMHAQFSTLLFGFTQSTGSAMQNITISNFAIYFTPYY